MTDLLTPEEVRELDTNVVGTCFIGCTREDLHRLCRDYLTLWDRHKDLEEYAASHEDVLRKITMREGRFSMDHHEHAMNTIEAMAGRAEAVLSGEEYDD